MKKPWGSPAAWCLLSALLFGASTPFSKTLVDTTGPVTLAGLLYIGAGLAVLPFAINGPRPSRVLWRRNTALLAGAVLSGGLLGPIALLWGLSLTPAATVSLWLNLETAATALLAWALFREHLGRRTWAAVLLVWGASVILASPGGFSGGWGALLVAAACVLWGADNNFTALIDGFTPAQSTAVKGLVAGLVNLALGRTLEPTSIGWTEAGLALLIGGIGYGVSIVLYIAGAQHLGATRSQMIFASAPFWGVVLSWGMLGEPVLGTQLLAGGLMVAAVMLDRGDRHEHIHTHESGVHTHGHRHDDRHHEHGHAGMPAGEWHSHEHTHDSLSHTHAHDPDLHHRHSHPPSTSPKESNPDT